MPNTTDVPPTRGGSRPTQLLFIAESGDAIASGQSGRFAFSDILCTSDVVMPYRVEVATAMQLEPCPAVDGGGRLAGARVDEDLPSSFNQDEIPVPTIYFKAILFLDFPSGAREWWSRMTDGAAKESCEVTSSSTRGGSR